MKQIIINQVLILISLFGWLIYRNWIKKHNNGEVTPSISYSAKLYQLEGNSPYFYFFIISLIAPLTYVGHLWFFTYAGSILMIIGTATGYNPNLKNIHWQNIIHVIATDLSILLFITGIIFMNPWLGIVVGLFGIPAIWIWIKGIKNATFYEEELVLYMALTAFEIQRVIIELIHLLK